MTEGSAVLAILRLLVSLSVVLTLVVLLARWAMKRGIGGSRAARTGLDIEVLARRGLGRGSAVHVVQVGEQVLVLGVTDQQVSLLRELEPVAAPVVVPSAVASVAASDDRDHRDDSDDDDDEFRPSQLDAFAAMLEAQHRRTNGGLTLVAPMTRVERREMERAQSRRSGLPSLPSLPARGTTPQEVPTGWPWSAATVVVGALRGRSA